MSTTKDNSRLLIDHIIGLTAKHIKEIQNRVKPMDTDCSLALSRYASSMVDIYKNIDKEEDREEEEFKKTISKMSIEELVENYNKMDKELK